MNRNFVRIDDAIGKVLHEEIVTAFLKLPTREQSYSLQIHESKSKRTWLGAYIAVADPEEVACASRSLPFLDPPFRNPASATV